MVRTAPRRRTKHMTTVENNPQSISKEIHRMAAKGWVFSHVEALPNGLTTHIRLHYKKG